MFKSLERAASVLPKEYRKTALSLFPRDGYPRGKGPALKQILDFAAILGLGGDNKRYFTTPLPPKELESLLRSFENNLELLIQKTWVEESEGIRKEKLLDRIPGFMAIIEGGKYSKALEEFGIILTELAWLFFGAQSQKDDFTEYTLRIDSRMGLFWWYGNQLSNPQSLEWIKRVDKEILKAILFLGVCFLTNF